MCFRVRASACDGGGCRQVGGGGGGGGGDVQGAGVVAVPIICRSKLV